MEERTHGHLWYQKLEQRCPYLNQVRKTSSEAGRRQGGHSYTYIWVGEYRLSRVNLGAFWLLHVWET